MQKTNVCGVISINLSIISILISPCSCVGIVFAIAGIIFGIIGVTKKNVMIGTAISGIIMGIFGSTIAILILVFQSAIMEIINELVK